MEKSLKLKKLRSSTPESLLEIGVTQETLNPLAILNDKSNTINLIVDEKLKSIDFIYFHPFDDCQTYGIELRALLDTFVEEGKTVEWANFAVKKAEDKKPVVAEPKDDKFSKLSQNKKSQLTGVTVGKEENFSEWYTEVIRRAELIQNYDISGCYILRPAAYAIWETITDFFNVYIKARGVKNCYFPLFVSEKALMTEKEHVAGFSPEVAWVTQYGESKLKEKVAIRPTSETVMYPAYANWIQTYKDLPLKLNQWCNVVRWEFKDPTPFIRTREFLWQEGHTAHATEECMKETVFDMLEGYRKVYEELLAVPVTKGIKTKSEQFPGADFTTTVEGFVCENGKGIQGATSHALGQNFSKMFKIQYLDNHNEKVYAWQTSWGLTTRSIGVMIMVHGDDKGLVLPPKVASIQVVIIPFHDKKGNTEEIKDSCKALNSELTNAGIRTHFDDRDHQPGFKFNDWELRGTPIRIELGRNEVDEGYVTINCRDQFGEKTKLSRKGIAEEILKTLEEIHVRMLETARTKIEARKIKCPTAEEAVTELKRKNMALVPWCGEQSCEENFVEEAKKSAEGEDVKLDGLKTLCIPLEFHQVKDGSKCFNCDKEMLHRVIFGKSY